MAKVSDHDGSIPSAAVGVWATSSEARHFRVRYERVSQMLSGMPGAATVPLDVEAQIIGVPVAEIALIRRELLARVNEAAQALSVDTVVRATIDQAITSWSGRTLVCLGDSITADRQSWAHILQTLLRDEVFVVNSGRSGDTTGHLISRFHASVTPFEPDGVIVLAGTNDGRQYTADLDALYGLSPEATSDEETRKNYLSLEALIVNTGATSMWIAPPPVIDSRIAQHPGIRSAYARWSDDASGRKASILFELFSNVRPALIDTDDLGALSELISSDGLHPTLRGQVHIATQAIRLLATTEPPQDKYRGEPNMNSELHERVFTREADEKHG